MGQTFKLIRPVTKQNIIMTLMTCLTVSKLGGLCGATKMQTHSLPTNVNVVRQHIKLARLFQKIIFCRV
jgi:hypothetical protein